MAALAQSVTREALVNEAVKSIPLPKGVKLSQIFFDSDHAGDLALRVIFSVSRKNPLTAARLRTLAKLDEKVADAVRPLQLGALSYVRFTDAA
ncbi:MAG TPA: hypothetical protein VHY48_00935 [Acidobacteriaceae bacterium]|nr:hypothetical protein [Acidobacteriaceae bacterium]